MEPYRLSDVLASLNADPGLEVRLESPEVENNVTISNITFDSREAVPGTLFVCKGMAFKEEYLEAAAAAGAVAYLSETCYPVELPALVVNDIKRAQAVLACSFYHDPSRDLSVVGITGTKGKTSTAFYIDAALRADPSHRSALITGLVIDDGATRIASDHNTTPEALVLQGIFRTAADAGCDTAVMEVSSQGLKVDRTYGTTFKVGVFINIGEDHVSPIEHPTLEDYFQTKLRLFAQCEYAVVNLETDRVSEVLDAARACKGTFTYSARPGDGADIQLVEADHVGEGSWKLSVNTPQGLLTFPFRALGRFNISNACAAIAVGQILGIPNDLLVAALENVHVPGRAERYDSPDGSIVGVVDYAHNGISLDALLRGVREEFPLRELTVVFGAIGHKAFERRRGLGIAAGSYADRIVMTEDDPGPARVEDIAREVGAYISELGKDYTVIPDRVEAVRYAIATATPPAVVVLAGKGTEDTILRGKTWCPIDPDAKQFCDAVGIPFRGYRELLGL